MDGLVATGFVVLGGPLADEETVVLAVEAGSEAEVRTTLALDPWSDSHLVVDTRRCLDDPARRQDELGTTTALVDGSAACHDRKRDDHLDVAGRRRHRGG